MRTLGIAVALTLMVVAAGTQPAQAVCSSPFLISALPDGGFIYSNPNFSLDYTQPGCYVSGCYYEAPTGPNFQANFWALTIGDPAVGVGADNGAFPDSIWIAEVAPPYNGIYFYYRQLFTNWGADARIDGCVADAGATPGQMDFTECTCIIMSDQWPTGPNNTMQGYFQIIGKQSDGTANFFLDDPSQTGFRLQPIPGIQILNSTRDANNDITFTVQVGAPTSGVFDPDGCGCVAGYKVLANSVPRGSMPPSDRSTGWVELLAADDSPQGITPLGGTVDVRSLCGASDVDVYLATQIVGQDGFVSSNVSSNSPRIECGPTLADPMRPARVPADRPLQLRDRREGSGRGK